jgi:hypothetical protein
LEVTWWLDHRIFVRPISAAEGCRLTRMTRTAKDRVLALYDQTPRAGENDVELVFLPTYSSWLNWIESESAALSYFAPNGTDHRSHAGQDDRRPGGPGRSAAAWPAGAKVRAS